MFQNYLITALRNFTRHKLYSFINIAGLAVGLACAIFVILFIRDELSYDKWIPGTENLYRVDASLYSPGHGYEGMAYVPFPVTTAMQAQIPEVAAQTHLIPLRMAISVGDRMFTELVDVVDPNFFRLIKLPFAEGDPTTALRQPESVVLSQEMARKYFGDKDALGRTVVLYASRPVIVTGVLRDLPHNTQFVADFVLPDTSRADGFPPAVLEKEWLGFGGYGYVQLAPGADKDAVLTKAAHILDGNIDGKRQMDVDFPGSKIIKLHLTRFRDVHLTPQENDGPVATAPGSWVVIYGSGTIAVLIVLIACFNFTNLATARALMRAREVSLRKVLGAQRRQLIVQFLGESIFTALLAAIVALALVEIFLPFFDGFIGRPIEFHYVADWPLTLGIFAIAILSGILGGLYPAFVLSGFRPATTLNSNSSGVGGAGLLRSSLVVLQFSVSIALGIAAIVVFAQINFARGLDLGFGRDNVVAIVRYGVQTDAASDSFVRALRESPDIIAASESELIPFRRGFDGHAQVPGSPDVVNIESMMVDPEFPRVYGIRLLAGRYLSFSQAMDANSKAQPDVRDGQNVLINEAAARRFGFTESSAVGRTIIARTGTRTPRLTVVGVLGDTKFAGLQTTVQPTIYYYDPAEVFWFSVRIKAGHTREALAFIDSTWHRFVPTRPIQRRFIGDDFEDLFAADRYQGAVFGIFVGIAIFIACLGLFGVAAFSSERRTKEIGVRKVFGARTRDIVRLLLWQFSIPVVIANVIAWPVAWYYLHHWLEGYAYRIALNPLYFVGVGLAALLIAWFTIIGHAIRVARSNPVHALRYE